MSAVLDFPQWDRPPLSLNDRPRHWAQHSKRVAEVRAAAEAACREALADGRLEVLEPLAVTLVWYAPTRARRDADNPVATLKALCDGLVDAGIVPDDVPEWMDKRPVEIVYRKGEPGVALHVETVAEVRERAAMLLGVHLGGEFLAVGEGRLVPSAVALAAVDVVAEAMRFAALPEGV